MTYSDVRRHGLEGITYLRSNANINLLKTCKKNNCLDPIIPVCSGLLADVISAPMVSVQTSKHFQPGKNYEQLTFQKVKKIKKRE